MVGECKRRAGERVTLARMAGDPLSRVLSPPKVAGSIIYLDATSP